MATHTKSGTPSVARPSGTVTFLFSDIEGSTERWERDRDAMGAALARHDATVRATLEAHGGYIFKTVGDEFCAAFATALDAVFAAIDTQRALATEDFSAVDGIRVRMALHTGSAKERGGDYFGTSVNRVARLLAIGHGAQILVSSAAAELLQGELPAEIALRDMGAHRLKNLAHPEHVYQLTVPDLPEAFLPLRSLSEIPNNLPRQLTSFVGRDAVVADIANLVEKHALVTLVGTGGVGKTRCALQAGAEMLDGSGDGVWLAELAPISDPALVAAVVARALSVHEQPNRSVLETLIAYLKRKRLLVILDNCEHVIEEARNVAAAILRACPEVHILATSREPLGVSGEEAYRVPSLEIPPGMQRALPESPERYGAVQLFLDRAISIEKRFGLTEENAPHVAEICRRLDGIPLAIELAAARLKVLSPQQLAKKLDERFRVLTGGDRGALPRQKTMRALIDWSYELLSNDERALFRKLGIFSGGFTLSTVAAVCSDSGMDEIAVLDLLSSLVDKSLVQAEGVESTARYRLLESTREYARERLIECGEYADAARAHATSFLALAEELDRLYETIPDRAWAAQVIPEFENWRSALEWAFGGRGDAALGQRLAFGLREMWAFFAMAEGRRWIRLAMSTTDANTAEPVIAGLDLAEAHLDAYLTQHRASYDAAERALARFQQLDDAWGAATAKWLVGREDSVLGRIPEAEAVLESALRDAERLGRKKLAGWILRALGWCHQIIGDVDRARERYAQSMAIAEMTQAERLAAFLASDFAEAEFRRGDAQAAVELAGRAHDAAFQNDARYDAMQKSNTAAYLVKLARYDEAAVLAREALTISRDLQFDVLGEYALQHLAAIAALRPCADPQMREGRGRAARILGYVDARLAGLDTMREYTEQQEYDAMIPALRDTIGEDELSQLMSEGSQLDEDRAVAEAMLI